MNGVDGPVLIRRRPGTGATWLYTGDNALEIAQWVNSQGGEAYIAEDGLHVETDRGDVIIDPGDRVTHGLVGEWYPLTPDAYAAGWEPV